MSFKNILQFERSEPSKFENFLDNHYHQARQDQLCAQAQQQAHKAKVTAGEYLLKGGRSLAQGMRQIDQKNEVTGRMSARLDQAVNRYQAAHESNMEDAAWNQLGIVEAKQRAKTINHVRKSVKAVRSINEHINAIPKTARLFHAFSKVAQFWANEMPYTDLSRLSTLEFNLYLDKYLKKIPVKDLRKMQSEDSSHLTDSEVYRLHYTYLQNTPIPQLQAIWQECLEQTSKSIKELADDCKEKAVAYVVHTAVNKHADNFLTMCEELAEGNEKRVENVAQELIGQDAVDSAQALQTIILSKSSKLKTQIVEGFSHLKTKVENLFTLPSYFAATGVA